MIKPRRSEEMPIPAETEYLISDIEELVNKNIDEHLDGYPFKISAKGYTPQIIEGKTPIGIKRIRNSYVAQITKNAHEFKSMDLQFNFPVQPSSENPLNFTIQWTDGIQCRLAIVDKRPVLLVEKGEDTEKVLRAASPNADEMTSYLNSIGLPESMWGSNLKNLIRDIDSSNDVRLQRSSTTIVDPFTNLEIIHDARYMQNDNGEQELVQELCLNIDHLDSGGPGGNGEMSLHPGSRFRNMLRFERDDSGSQWEYRGAYAGKLSTGEFINELVQVDPKLGVPNGKIIDKALTALSQRPY